MIAKYPAYIHYSTFKYTIVSVHAMWAYIMIKYHKPTLTKYTWWTSTLLQAWISPACDPWNVVHKAQRAATSTKWDPASTQTGGWAQEPLPTNSPCIARMAGQETPCLDTIDGGYTFWPAALHQLLMFDGGAVISPHEIRNDPHFASAKSSSESV